MTNRKPFLRNVSQIACAALVGMMLVASDLNAQFLQDNAVLASDAIIHRAGLMVEWSSQAPVGARNQVVDWELLIDENQATTTVEVRAGNRREVISQYDRDPLGELLGVAGAEELGQARKDHMLAEFAARGKKDVEVTVQTYQQPKATLFLMSDSGDVTALDANTGKTQWLSRVGTGSSPGIGLGANVNFVAVVRGSVLHCLEASTGKELWARKCKYAVGSSPAVTDKHIMVPLTDGRLELLPMETQGLGSHALMALGEGTSQPLVTANSVSWPTMRGELNVMMRNGNAHSISYRLRADDAIVSEATTDGKNLFVGSLDGFLYAIDEVRGSVNWAISLGVGISASPVPLGEFVYAISDDHKLYKVLADTGEHAEGWEMPLEEIGRYVGAGKENLYLLDSQGALAVVDRDSKSIVNRIAVGQIDLLLNNFQSDRMYIASKTGVIQCLREITSERPFFQNDEVVSKNVDKMASDEGSGSKNGSDTKQGSGTKQGSSNANPFAGSGDEDPFAGSGTKDQGSGTKDEGSGTKDEGSGTKDEGSGTKDEGSGTKGDDEDPFGGSSEDPFGGASDDEDPFG